MPDRSREYAKAWDELYRTTSQLVWGRLPIGFLDEFLRYVTPPLGGRSRVLDAGAGEGRNVAALQRTGARVSACDASLHGLRKLRSIAHGRVRCAQGDVARLPYRAGSFDLVLMADVIEALADPGPSLVEAWRVLRAGGALLCNIPDSTDPIAGLEMVERREEGASYLYRGRYFFQFFDARAAGAMIRRHGFEILRAEPRAWTEEAHPGFRAYSHQHVSTVFLAVKA